MNLKDLLDSSLIETATADTKQQAIDTLLGMMHRRGCIADLDAFRKEIYQREAEFSSDISPYLSIPHAKSPEVLRPAVAAMRTKDNRTVFLIASNDDNEHIKTLSALAEALLEGGSLQHFFEK